MEFLSNLALGFQSVLEPANLLYCFIGVLVGTLVGVLPGVGPTATIAMLLPMTYTLPPSAALIMLAGIYYGAQYGGSTTAILVNMPGEASSAVTAIDGYKMAQNGRAGPALSIAALGSFFAGTVATLIVATLAAPLSRIALQFGPTEYFSLVVVGLVCSVTLAHGALLNAFAMIVLGLLIGIVGTDIYTGAPRYTFGLYELSDGIDVAIIAVGLFGITEMLSRLEMERNEKVRTMEVASLMPNREEFRRSAMPIVRGSAIGSMLGILPGGGAVLSAFASYAIEKRLAKSRPFGNGAVEGVAGPESANNAGAQTSFIPMLTMGLPSNPVMALMIGAMIIQGLVPGPGVMASEPALFWGIIVSMWVGNLMLILLNLPLVGLWVRLLRIPYQALFPGIILFSSIGIYATNGRPFDVVILSLAGFAGYLFHKLDCEPAPLLIGVVLGPMLEEYFRRAMVLSHGDLITFVTSPLSCILLLIAVLMIATTCLPSLSSRREQIFAEQEG
jgi:TctA family transporter